MIEDALNPFKVKLLAIDDDPQSLALISAALKRPEIELITESNPVVALDIVRKRGPQIALVDLMMPGLSGLEVLERILAVDAAVDVILMTAHYSTESAVQAIQRGACDYLNKPLPLDRLRERVDRLVKEAQRRAKARQLDQQLIEACRFEGIIGRGPLMLDVFARIGRMAPHFRTALLTGPSGTGKELTARAIHHLSPVASGPLVVCNCAAIPESLAESELFGHMRGSFTGATADKAGVFEAAHGGILFLDEVGEMPLPLQAKLLRAVQNQEVQRIGATSVRKVNVRIIAATNRDLRVMVREKSFREDLFFRLCMVEIKLPSLGERREDLPLLLRYFVERFARAYNKNIEGLTRRAEALLARYEWPGNIRELENVIGYACMMTDSEHLDIGDLPDYFHNNGEPSRRPHVELVSADEIQRLHARRVLDYLDGDKVKAAEILGVSRATLYR
ncbi:MAG: sigma-54-dependent Fis family transcriptional regulator, partial [Acidobacteriaceae bacterium]|nr:sigma-54-dependent Fis family transcriptional regulator [Acidobacteriaceae bacterium]